MEKCRLPNGLTLIYQHSPTNSVTLHVSVKVGSNHEQPHELGISHFVEHMLFEGTKQYKTSKELTNEIEKLGGDFNAYTTDERTCFYIKVLQKHLPIAFKVIDNVINKPLLLPNAIKKEKKIILNEIKMVTDEPRYHQWVLFEKTLYKNHPKQNPTYGSKETVSSITRRDLLKFYQTNYVPNNTIITIAGNGGSFSSVKKLVNRYFSSRKLKSLPKKQTYQEPPQSRINKQHEKRPMHSSYLVMGYKTVPRTHPDSYIFDVIKGIIGRGQSGKMFYEIRTKLGLGYDVGVSYEYGTDYGLFAVNVGTDKKHLSLCEKKIYSVLKNLTKTTKKELKEAKTYVEGSFSLDKEDTFELADALSYWELMGNARLFNGYLKKINSVTLADIKRVVKQYFRANYTLVTLQQKK